MAETKTKPTAVDPAAFIAAIPDAAKRDDAVTLLELFRSITGEPPVMWGPTMIGFGTYHYKYASGHEGDCFATGFSPRKAALTLYVTKGFEAFPELMAKLGTYKTGKCCLYIKRLSDIHMPTLKKLIKAGLTELKAEIKTRKAGGA